MHDCFNMAYQDNKNALQLHIKVNSENLLPFPQKYNAGSLRIPDDPSWPKIPQRRLPDNATNIIEPPYVVTLTGSPRRSRALIRTPLNQSTTTTEKSTYSSIHDQHSAWSTHTLKRPPGGIDPRFKKKNPVSPHDPLEKGRNPLDQINGSRLQHAERLRAGETEKAIAERDITAQQQEAEKPDETRNIHINQQNVFENATFKNEIREENNFVNNSSFRPTSDIKPSTIDSNKQAEIASLPVQESSGQLFFVVDKKTQAHSVNAIHVDTTAVPQECGKQYYNVQVPIITYQNVPVEIETKERDNVIEKSANKPETGSVQNEIASRALNSNNNLSKQSIGISVNQNIPEKLLDAGIQRKQQESSDSEYYLPNTFKKRQIYEAKPKNKSEENLSVTKNESTRKLLRNSEPYITFKQKKASAKLSRKAKSYFQKNSHSALADTDYAVMWPDCQYNTCKRSQSNLEKSDKYEETLHSASEILRMENYKQDFSPRTNAEDAVEKPKSIPIETQKLLNKSYWEYYNKLRHKIKNASSTAQRSHCRLTVDPPEIKKRKADNLDNPELQTLQQCTALSSMINKALGSSFESFDGTRTRELYPNGNVKASSVPTTRTQSATKKNLNLHKDKYNDNAIPLMVINNAKHKKDKREDIQFLELKTIIFFSSMMYILIIFLPMLYNYFYHDDYDDYENANYAELILDYILSSFKEAFGSFFGGATSSKNFKHPRACKKCSDNA